MTERVFIAKRKLIQNCRYPKSSEERDAAAPTGQRHWLSDGTHQQGSVGIPDVMHGDCQFCIPQFLHFSPHWTYSRHFTHRTQGRVSPGGPIWRIVLIFWNRPMTRGDGWRSKRFRLSVCCVCCLGIGYSIRSGRDLDNLYTSGTRELHRGADGILGD